MDNADGLCGKRAPEEDPRSNRRGSINRKPNPLLPGLLFAQSVET